MKLAYIATVDIAGTGRLSKARQEQVLVRGTYGSCSLHLVVFLVSIQLATPVNVSVWTHICDRILQLTPEATFHQYETNFVLDVKVRS